MRLPIGCDNFQEIIEKKLDFVDKTLFIKEVLDDIATEVSVITRPRRFGKTLNLSMLHYFLSEKVNGEKTQGLFDGLKIAQSGNEYMQHQGKYPVVFVTLKDIKESNYDLALQALSKVMMRLYNDHISLLDSDGLMLHQKKEFEAILEEKANKASLQYSLLELMKCIYLHHKVKPWLLMDEYDTPIQSGYINGYYKEIIEFMGGMLGTVLKTNPYMEKAVIAGILRIPRDSIFSGLNNLTVYSVLNKKYSEYFGFTENEVDDILKKSNLLSKAEEIRDWYNGYKVGETIICNPWSIVNCIKQNGETKPYWVNTSDNQVIKDLLKKSPLSFKNDFEILVSGGDVEKLIDENVVFQYLNNNPSAVWSLLLMAGYLKPVASRQTDQGVFAHLAIPNREVRNLYRQIVEQWLSNGYGIEWYNDFIESLLRGEMENFKKHLGKVILQIISYHDFATEPEAFYHGLMLGFTVSLHGLEYEIQSNRESGLGRFDIMIIPRDNSQLGIVIELKVSDEKEDLIKVADMALKQIDEKKYPELFKSRGIKEILKLGIGFYGKAFEMVYVREIVEGKNPI